MRTNPKNQFSNMNHINKILILLAMSMVSVVSAYAIEANNNNGIPGITASINTERIHRSGNEVQFVILFKNNTAKDENGVNISFADSHVSIDGEAGYPIDGQINWGSVDLPAEETTGVNTWIMGVPKNAGTITSLKIVGRAPNSKKANANNYYGDYDYKFTNVEIPKFKASNKEGCVFYDNQIELNVGQIVANGNDLAIDFTLTNLGRRDVQVSLDNWGKGIAKTPEGEEFKVSTKFPSTLPTGEKTKGQIVISNGAKETFSTIKQKFLLTEPGLRFEPELILRNISL